MKYVFTNHAEEQMTLRGVTRTQVIQAIERGSKQLQTEGVLATYGYIAVAYRTAKNLIIIKTVILR
jgi:hypothetical protein